MNEWIAIYSAAVASIVSGVGVAFQRRQTTAAVSEHEATAADITVETALSLIDPLRERVKTLEQKVDALSARCAADGIRITHREEGVATLTGQLLDLGHKPNWP